MKDNKNNNHYIVKSLPSSLKDLDTVGRRVKVMLSAFNVIDADNEMIIKGAFTKSLLERGTASESNRRIAFLRNHDWEHQIGKWVVLEETEEGLIGVAEMGRTAKANDAFYDYQDGILREHSIGFNKDYDKIDFGMQGINKYAILKEVQLWEGSGVTFGANSLTPVLDVSKGNHITQIARINDEMDSVIRALKNGKGTDERLYNYEMKLKVLKQRYNDIFNAYPVIATSQKEESIVPSEDQEGVQDQTKKQLLINLIQNKCL